MLFGFLLHVVALLFALLGFPLHVVALLFALLGFPLCITTFLLGYFSISGTRFFMLFLLVCCYLLKFFIVPPCIPFCKSWERLGVKNQKSIFSLSIFPFAYSHLYIFLSHVFWVFFFVFCFFFWAFGLWCRAYYKLFWRQI
jgi:hypothetical protein